MIRWKYLHNWWIEDFRFEYSQKESIVDLLKKHPDDPMGDSFRSMIKEIDKRLVRMRREYKKVYGANFKITRDSIGTYERP